MKLGPLAHDPNWSPMTLSSVLPQCALLIPKIKAKVSFPSGGLYGGTPNTGWPFLLKSLHMCTRVP